METKFSLRKDRRTHSISIIYMMHVMSHVVLFAYPINRVISRQEKQLQELYQRS